MAVFNARFVKPLPEAELLDLAGRFKRLLVVEENALAGGFGSAVLEFYNDKGLLASLTLKRLGLPDQFVEHGAPKDLRAKVGIDKGAVKKALAELCLGAG